MVYSRSHYDGIIVYETYQRRSDPTWFNIQITLYNDRCAGRAPCPPRTLFVNGPHGDRILARNPGLVTTRQLALARGVRTEHLDVMARQHAMAQARAIQQVSPTSPPDPGSPLPGVRLQARVRLRLRIPDVQAGWPVAARNPAAQLRPSSVTQAQRPVDSAGPQTTVSRRFRPGSIRLERCRGPNRCLQDSIPRSNRASHRPILCRATLPPRTKTNPNRKARPSAAPWSPELERTLARVQGSDLSTLRQPSFFPDRANPSGFTLFPAALSSAISCSSARSLPVNHFSHIFPLSCLLFPFPKCRDAAYLSQFKTSSIRQT